ncbi:MAG: amidase [Mesorhizobium sp.]|uniref:amidase n=1 Tax=Mesorhizobium sp. TaxID=1871066 RepID=UPI0012018AAC|nr:amidase [Mesorhizobium sp.]TIS53964.1 MAG: amidase [Mesorhizobium sp.]
MAEITDSFLETYAESDALDLAGLVKRGEVTPAELVEAAITMIERLNPALNAVIHRLYDTAHTSAEAVDRNAPFAGVPFLLKELASSWTGAPNTNSCFFLKDIVADFDTEVVRRMKAAGLVLVGKSNAPENGWSITTEPKLYWTTKNPWKEGITPGGSSGGAAAAIASRMVPIAEASDGAGSIRVPASCCGIVGLKPSRGRVSLAPFGDYWYGSAYFLCCSRTVRDTSAYLDAVAGVLPGDPYTPPIPSGSWLDLSSHTPKKLRVGFSVTPPNGTPINPEVKATVLATVAVLERLGHDVEEHDMPLDAEAVWKTYTNMTCVQTAATFGYHETVIGRPVTPDDIEPVTWAIIERGRSTSGIRHISDIEQLRQVGRDIVGDLVAYDLFVTPTLTQLPRPLGYYDMSEPDIDRYNAKWTDAVFAFPFNISGQPAISLPLGWSGGGVPIGVQLIGRYGDEAMVLAISTQMEQEMPWKHRRPSP